MSGKIPIENVRDILRDCIQVSGMMNAPHQKAVKFIVKNIERELRHHEATTGATPTTKDG